jgi:hypothetical protein
MWWIVDVVDCRDCDEETAIIVSEVLTSLRRSEWLTFYEAFMKLLCRD